MGLFSGYLICSDIDGTLVRSDKCLSDTVRETLAWYTAEGGRFTVTTGRTPNEMAGFDSSILSAPLILSSGSLIVDPAGEAPILDLPFDRSGYEIAREIWETHPEIETLIVDDPVPPMRLDRNGETDFVKLRETLSFDWHKVLLVVADGDTRASLEQTLQETYGGDYVFDSAWYRSVEMHRGDKGTGALALKRSLGAKVLCCVGDHTNDIPMICAADIGCAMGNALPEVKSAADHVLPSNDEEGIAYMIHHLREWAGETKID